MGHLKETICLRLFEAINRNVQHLFRDKPLDEITFEQIMAANSGEISENDSGPLGTTSEMHGISEDESDKNDDDQAKTMEGEMADNLAIRQEFHHDQVVSAAVERKRKLSDEEHGNEVSEAKVRMKSIPASGKKLPKQRKRPYASWSKLEDELHEIFANCFKSLKTPTRQQVSSRLILCDASDELKKRGAALIVKKISAEVQKMKHRK